MRTQPMRKRGWARERAEHRAGGRPGTPARGAGRADDGPAGPGARDRFARADRGGAVEPRDAGWPARRHDRNRGLREGLTGDPMNRVDRVEPWWRQATTEAVVEQAK